MQTCVDYIYSRSVITRPWCHHNILQFLVHFLDLFFSNRSIFFLSSIGFSSGPTFNFERSILRIVSALQKCSGSLLIARPCVCVFFSSLDLILHINTMLSATSLLNMSLVVPLSKLSLNLHVLISNRLRTSI